MAVAQPGPPQVYPCSFCNAAAEMGAQVLVTRHVERMRIYQEESRGFGEQVLRGAVGFAAGVAVADALGGAIAATDAARMGAYAATQGGGGGQVEQTVRSKELSAQLLLCRRCGATASRTGATAKQYTMMRGAMVAAAVVVSLIGLILGVAAMRSSVIGGLIIFVLTLGLAIGGFLFFDSTYKAKFRWLRERLTRVPPVAALLRQQADWQKLVSMPGGSTDRDSPKDIQSASAQVLLVLPTTHIDLKPILGKPKSTP